MERQDDQLTLLGRTTYRDRRRLFGVKLRDRRHHVYVIGQSGTGKSTLLRSMMRQDEVDGVGFALLDPHGDLSSGLVAKATGERSRRIVSLDLPNPQNPYGFNPLKADIPELRPVAAAGMLDVFKKLWSDSWGPRMEHLLRYAFLALVETPGATMLDLLPLFDDDQYRRRVGAGLRNRQVQQFWLGEFEDYSPSRRAEAVAPIRNKVGAFLAHPRMQAVLGPSGHHVDLADIMDNGTILVVNLAKGQMGDDASALFGALLLSTLVRVGLERAARPATARTDFAVYLDEFQTFTTLAVAEMLAELRKYGVHLVLAHQYLAQLDDKVREAILGNAGTLVVFRAGLTEARVFASIFDSHITPGDIIRLPNHEFYVRPMVEGSPRAAFSGRSILL